jgi:GT2 family glycosyltransferase
VTDRTVGATTVVVCAYTERRWDDLAEALHALRGQTRPADEVLLVIDHDDALLRRARAAWDCSRAHGVVRVLPSTGSRGLSGARNTGLDAAGGAIVAFLDDDAVPEPDWLEQLTAPFGDPRVAAVGGTALPRWAARGPHRPGRRPRWWPAEFDWVVGCSHLGLPPDGGEVRNVLGATMAFRATALGGERFSDRVGRVGGGTAGCEETELCIRLRQRDPHALIVLEPRARVRHRVPAERQRLGYFVSRCFAEGRSKAVVARLVGSGDGLSTERGYVASTLPAGVLHGLGSALRGDPAGVARAGAIGLGLAVTTAGYLRGRSTPAPDFEPVQLLQLELSGPGLVGLAPSGVAGLPYRRARVLVRDRGRPVGATEIPLIDGRPAPGALEQVRADFAATPSRTAQPDGDEAVGGAMPGGLRATVVVATHNRPDALARCLRSLRATGYPDLRVIVVDNAPDDDATEQLVSRDFPEVRYVREDVPGLARAHNAALPLVETPVVAFTDDDVVVDPDWARALVAQFATSPRIACVTGLIWPAELETPGQVAVDGHGGFGKGFEWRMFNLNGSRPDDPLFPYTAGSLGSGANMAFRTDVLRGLGGFDPALGAGSPGRGGDDLAAFYDVVTAGWSLVYEPAAIVHHHHRKDVEAVKMQAANYGAGLGAYLTRVVVRRPAVLADFARLAPRAVAHLIAGHDQPGPTTPSAAPSAGSATPLLARQVVGMAKGPLGYARGTRSARRRAS